MPVPLLRESGMKISLIRNTAATVTFDISLFVIDKLDYYGFNIYIL
jgi:hypothetical protein